MYKPAQHIGATSSCIHLWEAALLGLFEHAYIIIGDVGCCYFGPGNFSIMPSIAIPTKFNDDGMI
jgi:hypothetical protein